MRHVEVWGNLTVALPWEDNGFQLLSSSWNVLSQRTVEPHRPWREDLGGKTRLGL